MSFAQNMSYSVVQVVHNLGAVLAVGGSLSAVVLKKVEDQKKLAWIALTGWGVQGLSGATFGVVSYFFYHRFPEIAGIAVYALVIKIICTAVAVVLLLSNLIKGPDWPNGKKNYVMMTSFMLAIIALSAAAILRWFS